jgi:hypothetical protein
MKLPVKLLDSVIGETGVEANNRQGKPPQDHACSQIGICGRDGRSWQ